MHDPNPDCLEFFSECSRMHGGVIIVWTMNHLVDVRRGGEHYWSMVMGKI